MFVACMKGSSNAGVSKSRRREDYEEDEGDTIEVHSIFHVLHNAS